MKKALFLWAMICTVLFCGCSGKKTGESADIIEGEAVFVGCKAGEIIVSHGTEQFSLEASDYLPIVREGKLFGEIEIKQVERVGIPDWTNQTAVQNSVNHSYSIAMVVRLRDNLLQGENLNLYVSPYLYSGGEQLGELCDVGWTGFPSFAQLFDGNLEKWIEVGIQPYIEDLPEDTELVLKLSDNNGSAYQDVRIQNCLVNAVEGPNLHTLKDSAEVISTNGSVFKLSFSSLHFEQQVDSLELNDSPKSYYYTFKRKVKYVNGPNNERNVSLFDKYNKNALNTDFVIGLQGSTDKTITYDRNLKAARLKYVGDSTYYEYVTVGKDVIECGKTAKVTDNRIVPDTTNIVPEYVRFRVEFPEEAQEMTNEELLSFSGRFLVFQGRPEGRKLKERKW